MKTLRIAWKTLIELVREPVHLGFALFFPIILVLFYYMAFGQTKSGLSNYLRVLIVNDDAGISRADSTHWSAGTDLVVAARELEYDGQAVFDVVVVNDAQEARVSLLERKAALLLVIPPDLSRALAEAAAGGQTSPASLTAVGDPASDSFVFASSFLEGLVREFGRQAVGWQEESLAPVYEFVPGTGTMSDFDYGIPGLILFGLMFAMITTPIALVREKTAGTLPRLRLTRARAGHLLIGVTLAQMVVMALQVPITLVTAAAFGFRSQGSLLLAAVIFALLGLAAVGAGLIIASFSRTEGDAVNLASGALLPMVFMSGAVFPLPAAPLFTVAGQTIEAYDILPTTHGAEALRRVMVLGDGARAIGYELAGLAILSLAMLALGIVLYQRLQMRNA